MSRQVTYPKQTQMVNKYILRCLKKCLLKQRNDTFCLSNWKNIILSNTGQNNDSMREAMSKSGGMSMYWHNFLKDRLDSQIKVFKILIFFQLIITLLETLSKQSKRFFLMWMIVI